MRGSDSSLGHRRARFYARNCRLGHAGRSRRRAHFYAGERRPGDDGSCRRLARDRRGSRGRSHHDPRLLPGLGDNSSRSGRRRCRTALTLPTQVWPQLTRRTLAGRTLARDILWGQRRARCTRGRAGERRTAGRTRNTRTRSGRRERSHGRRLGCPRGRRGHRMDWNRGLGRLGLNRLRNGRPLGYGRSFIFSLLDRLEDVAWLRYP
jgi:hypothetical protein